MTADQIESLKRILDYYRCMLSASQRLRIQQVQAANDAKWTREWTDAADKVWRELNRVSEQAEMELVKLVRGPISVNCETVLAMLGGKYPDSGQSSEGWPSGFAFDQVDHYEIEDGELVPYSGGLPLPGPSFKLVMV